MPHQTVFAPMEPIVRYRCYACGEPWWEFLSDYKVVEGHNTITCLCDPCEDRRHKEGAFWQANSRKAG